MITRDIFEQGLDRWGGTLEHWPSPDRRGAEELLATSVEARRDLALMRDIEVALALPALDIATTQRFAAVATRHPQQRRTPPALRRAGWSAAAAAALVLGIIAGDIGTSPIREDTPDGVLASALTLSTGNADVD